MNIPGICAAAVAAVFLTYGTLPALAAGGHSGGHGDQPDIGQAGSADHVNRVIRVSMGEMYFSPSDLQVLRNETIRFVIKNDGEFVHEFNLGTTEMHLAHAEEMMMMVESGVLESDRINHDMMNMTEMAHDDANSVLLEPGESAEILWTFSGDAALELSCNIPGHRESGMLSVMELVAELN